MCHDDDHNGTAYRKTGAYRAGKSSAQASRAGGSIESVKKLGTPLFKDAKQAPAKMV